MKRKTGRPVVYDDNFYLRMYHEHEDYSISQMAELHKVSLSTIKNWIRKGKLLYEQQK